MQVRRNSQGYREDASMSKKQQPKPAKRRPTEAEKIVAKFFDWLPEEAVDHSLVKHIERVIRAAVKEAAHCEREFVYDALSDMGHHALCKQLRERINKHTRKYGAKP